MHKFMRAIGFSKLNRKETQRLVTDVIVDAGVRSYTSLDGDNVIACFSKEVAPGIGLTVVGEFDEDDQFSYDYYFPFVEATNVSTEEDVNIERHIATESYAGVFEDPRMGISVIFYLQNMIPYIKAMRNDELPMQGVTLSLSALALDGTILMPLKKTAKDIVNNHQATKSREKLVLAARLGDEDAIENLTLNDMDTYTTIAQKIQKEDVFTLVDTYFMPYGAECDQYSILGEILEVQSVTNSITHEELYHMSLLCNDMIMKVCINKEDVFGEPAIGRRFKGNIWLQGKINFPMSS
ncbi:MAG: DUF3881 family protein [Lachnospiraceae bacterium]|nr:DUF3881 family protein [Lachnospiraceae bacterium]